MKAQNEHRTQDATNIQSFSRPLNGNFTNMQNLLAMLVTNDFRASL